MTTLTLPPPPVVVPSVPNVPRTLRLFSVAEYHQMIAAGILDVDDRVELLEGFIVCKMPRNPPHDSRLHRTMNLLNRLLPPNWCVRPQMAITLSDSAPEPDLTVTRGDEFTYDNRHPTPTDIGFVVEVADSTLLSDRRDKARIYARAALPVYWIVNIPDAIVEVYTDPTGPDANPRYGQRRDYTPTEEIPVVLAGAEVGRLRVAELRL